MGLPYSFTDRITDVISEFFCNKPKSTETEIETERERVRERETDRQTGRETEGHKDR